MGILSIVLGIVVVLDHALAAIPGIQSNSTGQAILNAIGAIASAIQGVVGGGK